MGQRANYRESLQFLFKNYINYINYLKYNKIEFSVIYARSIKGELVRINVAETRTIFSYIMYGEHKSLSVRSILRQEYLSSMTICATNKFELCKTYVASKTILYFSVTALLTNWNFKDPLGNEGLERPRKSRCFGDNNRSAQIL